MFPTNNARKHGNEPRPVSRQLCQPDVYCIRRPLITLTAVASRAKQAH